MKLKLITVTLVLTLFAAACGSPVPSTSDWCYRFDFRTSDIANLVTGVYDAGYGYGTDGSGDLSFNYIQGATVESVGVQIYGTRAILPADADIDVTANINVFGIALSGSQTVPITMDAISIPVNPTYAGTIGNSFNISVNASEKIDIGYIDVYGNNDNPFGTSNCYDGTATPTDTAVMTATRTPTSGTPTETSTPSDTPTAPTPTATPTCITTDLDLRTSDYGMTNFHYNGFWQNGFGIRTGSTTTWDGYTNGYRLDGLIDLGYSIRLTSGTTVTLTDTSISNAYGWGVTGYETLYTNPVQLINTTGGVPGESTQSQFSNPSNYYTRYLRFQADGFNSYGGYAQVHLVGCLLTPFTATPTATGTATPITPTRTSTPTHTATRTAIPLFTYTPVVGTGTPITPSTTPSPSTPTITLSPTPSRTPLETSTPFPTLRIPTFTAANTSTPAPTWTPLPTSVPTDVPPCCDSGGSIGDVMSNFLNSISVSISNWLNTASDNLNNGLSSLSETLTTALNGASDSVTQWLDKLSNWLVYAFNAMSDMLVSFLNYVSFLGDWIIQAVGDFVDWLVQTALNIAAFIVSLVNFIVGIVAGIINLWVSLLSFVIGMIQFILSLIGQLIGILGMLISIAFNVLAKIVGWITDAIVTLGNLATAWSNAQPTDIPYLPHCSTQPMNNDICAVYYILQFTIFSGSVGGLLLPMMLIIVDLMMILLVVKSIRDFVLQISRALET